MSRCASVVMVMPVAALDHDHLVTAMVAMPAMTMSAEFGAGAVRAVVMMMIAAAALDHHRLRTCERRRRDHERTESRNHITKLRHDVLLQTNAHLNRRFARTFRRSGERILNGCSDEGVLIAALLRGRRRTAGDVFAVADRVLAALAAIPGEPTFRTLPGGERKREVCAECYEKIMADRRLKRLALSGAELPK